MNFQHLIVLASVGKYLNLTRVSEVLHTSQPAISRSLKMLEEDLKAKLYARKGRGIELTEKGKSLLTKIKSPLAQLENLQAQFKGENAVTAEETLEVGGTTGPCTTLLPSIQATFHKSYPEVRVNLRIHSRKALEKLIHRLELEFAVVLTPPRSPHIAAEPL